jgi:hypothetical protein
MLLVTVSAAESVQNYQNLPKFAQKQLAWGKFEIPPKVEILVFFKSKNFYV